MNWLGLSTRSLLGIVLGVVLAVTLFLYVYPSVLVVGAGIGVGCALLAEDRSVLRGLSVATVAAWVAAALDARRLGISTFQISSVLTLSRLLVYLASIVTAFGMGALSIKRAAKTRPAGT